jgi:SAM-dependent methyltransferase
MKIKDKLSSILMPHGLSTFIQKYIPANGKVLDVGCGNNSPLKTKRQRSDVYYIGLDIGIYCQSSDPMKIADEFILETPEKFHLAIEQFSDKLDAVISSHNLEHCDDYKSVIAAIIKSLKRGGVLFFAFPCEDSVHFPHRKGTLNFYDDSTHKNIIPYDEVIYQLKQAGFDILFTNKNYKPLILFIIGFLYEPISRLTKKLGPGFITWSYYGFESIIIAKKL